MEELRVPLSELETSDEDIYRDAVRCRCAGGVRRYWFRDGTLALERGEDWSREYYPSGALREERRADPDGGTRSVWYGEDGTWAVRTKTGPREPGKRLPPDPDIVYNDAYIRTHYLELLKVSAFGHHFLDWLFRQMEPKKAGSGAGCGTSGPRPSPPRGGRWSAP